MLWEWLPGQTAQRSHAWLYCGPIAVTPAILEGIWDPFLSPSSCLAEQNLALGPWGQDMGCAMRSKAESLAFAELTVL